MACRPCASITFASLSSVTSATLSAAFTNAFDPASSAPAQVQVECYQMLMQSPDIPIELVCLVVYSSQGCFGAHSFDCGFSSGRVFVRFFSLFLCPFCVTNK